MRSGAGVEFWGYEDGGALVGVMGLQQVEDVTLIRHAYVLTESQGRGIGDALIAELKSRTETPLLIGTWAAAEWAIRFYQRRGFCLVDEAEKRRLLETYWTVPEPQIRNSVVLVDEAWRARNS